MTSWSCCDFYLDVFLTSGALSSAIGGDSDAVLKSLLEVRKTSLRSRLIVSHYQHSNSQPNISILYPRELKL
jgi:hypothetical protein